MNKKYGRVRIAIVLAVLLTAMCGCSQKIGQKETHTKVEKQKSVQEEIKKEDKEEQEPLKKEITIAIDPGHQSEQIDMSGLEENGPGSSTMKRKATGGTRGNDTGKMEYELNMEISLQLKEKLEEQGFQTILTRDNNETAVSNKERALLSNQADLVVRIHANGSEAEETEGALCLIMSRENPYVGELYDSSYQLAKEILEYYCQKTGFQNRGISENDTMTGINWSKIPVVILEMGFMTNSQDDQKMADPQFQKIMVQGIADGIVNYISYDVENQPRILR